jgi:hypothetical protein
MKRLVAFVVVAVFVGAALPAFAQAKAASPAVEFYTAYRAAWAAAKSFQDIVKLHSKASAAQLAKIPADQQKMMFQMSKEMDPKDVKVVKETATPNGAVLDLTGTADGKTVKGTAELVKEDGAWKMVKEDWQL